MTTNASNITIHVVQSLDGYIAKEDNSISWFETTDYYENGVPEEDPTAFLAAIDCYVMGANTYEYAKELSKEHGWGYGDKPTYVLTARNLSDERENIVFVSGDLKQFVEEQLRPHHKNIWVVGGAMLINEFLQQGLADELNLSILPIILGGGLPLFSRSPEEQSLHLSAAKAYKNGIVELCYEVKK
ncbi:MAG TPA: dihydrofolate reductase family protein [Fluviicola sp.]|nr:dihydrofolate reductase family protein [Fluviicola sp.]